LTKKITEKSLLFSRNRNLKLFQALRTFPDVNFLRLKQILMQILCFLKSAITKWQTSHNRNKNKFLLRGSAKVYVFKT